MSLVTRIKLRMTMMVMTMMTMMTYRCVRVETKARQIKLAVGVLRWESTRSQSARVELILGEALIINFDLPRWQHQC